MRRLLEYHRSISAPFGTFSRLREIPLGTSPATVRWRGPTRADEGRLAFHRSPTPSRTSPPKKMFTIPARGGPKRHPALAVYRVRGAQGSWSGANWLCA